MTEALKAGTKVKAPVPVFEPEGTKWRKVAEVMLVGSVLQRSRRHRLLTRDQLGQYLIRIGLEHDRNALVVVATDAELELA